MLEVISSFRSLRDGSQGVCSPYVICLSDFAYYVFGQEPAVAMHLTLWYVLLVCHQYDHCTLQRLHHILPIPSIWKSSIVIPIPKPARTPLSALLIGLSCSSVQQRKLWRLFYFQPSTTTNTVSDTDTLPLLLCYN